MTRTTDPIRRVLAGALLAFPCLFILVFLMHFRHWADFFHFRLHYVPRAPESVVTSLVHAQNNWPMIHDPHILAYLSLPLIPLCAFALYFAGMRQRPLLSACTMLVTITGTIYLGGVFGMWTAFYRGLGLVPPADVQGAIATFKALTADQGAFFLTTTLAKLTMLGLSLQALALVRLTPTWAIACIVTGALLFLLFWDLDNWMMLGTVLMLAGFTPIRRALLTD